MLGTIGDDAIQENLVSSKILYIALTQKVFHLCI